MGKKGMSMQMLAAVVVSIMVLLVIIVLWKTGFVRRTVASIAAMTSSALI